jgi:hypothetical protein
MISMTFETWFSVAGIVAMSGWLVLLGSPLIPTWSDRIAGSVLPIALSLGYLALLVVPASASGGGFDSLAAVIELFSFEQAALAGGSTSWPSICSSAPGCAAPHEPRT